MPAITGSPEKSLAKYCPHTPWPKQRLFLDCNCEELLFGGAAGPGKTDVLLMAALQYVHVPGYAALILRKDTMVLALANSILSRAREWLSGTDAKYNGNDRSFTFPSGARIDFNYLDNPNDRFRYKSSEYHYIGWEELTEFSLTEGEENPYLYLFSRFRKPEELNVPLRFRAATNPGDRGHMWVKNRFITDEATKFADDPTPRIFYMDESRDRGYIPGLISDNPALNADEYNHTLRHLPPVTRARLMRGDWSVVEDAQFHADWLRRYSTRGGRDSILDAYRKDRTIIPSGIECSRCRRIAVIDTAGTSEEKARDKRGKPPSWSVVSIWDYSPDYGKFLFLRHIWRRRVGWIDLEAGAKKICSEWNVKEVHIENAHVGPALCEVMKRAGFNARTVTTKPNRLKSDGGVPGKLERATNAINKYQRGEVLLPEDNNDWLLSYEAELLSWTGHPDETNDQIDVTSHAVNILEQGSGTVILSRTSKAASSENLRGWAGQG